MTAAWTQGYALDDLKAAAAPFKAAYRGYAHGAFGVPNERDVAAARVSGRLCREGSASAIAGRLTRPSVRMDFAGRRVVLPAGDLLIEHFAAGEGDDGAALLASLIADMPAAWAFAHVENAAVEALFRAAGFEHVATRVAASSDLIGIYLWAADGVGREWRRPEPLPSAEAATLTEIAGGFLAPAGRAALLAEAEAFVAAGGTWAQHYSAYNLRRSWDALAIWGYDPGDPGFIVKPDEMARAWQSAHPEYAAARCVPTIAAPHFPTVARVLERLEVTPNRVRLMRLAANGGELSRHADITNRDAGAALGKLARLHMPLLTDPACTFTAWDTCGRRIERHLAAGGLYYLDQRKPHRVRNDGGAARIHLVIDAYVTPALARMIADSVAGGGS